MPARLRILALVVAAACFGGPAAAGDASDLLYERTVMAQAGVRCGLFQPPVLNALQAARLQARGAALRAGGRPDAVAALEARARERAERTDCRASGLQTAAARVRQAFADYAQLHVMTFPGPRSAWRAERPDPRLPRPRWSLVEQLPGSGGWMLFGLVDGRPALLDARRAAVPAAFARIGVRDLDRVAQPYLLGPPPPSLARVFLASGRGAAARALLPAGAAAGVLYRFPPELAGELARLDPREQASVALAYPGAGRDRMALAVVEVGDFAAAQAFLASGVPLRSR
jgi:hypothetical protein